MRLLLSPLKLFPPLPSIKDAVGREVRPQTRLRPMLFAFLPLRGVGRPRQDLCPGTRRPHGNRPLQLGCRMPRTRHHHRHIFCSRAWDLHGLAPFDSVGYRHDPDARFSRLLYGFPECRCLVWHRRLGPGRPWLVMR